MTDSLEESPLYLALSKAIQHDRTVALKALPPLFDHYISSLKRHRGAIINTSSSSRVSNQTEVNSASLKLFSCLRNLVDAQKRDVLAWDAVSQMVDIIGRENVYDPQSGLDSLKHEVDVALNSLSEICEGQPTVFCLIQLLICTGRPGVEPNACHSSMSFCCHPSGLRPCPPFYGCPTLKLPRCAYPLLTVYSPRSLILRSRSLCLIPITSQYLNFSSSTTPKRARSTITSKP
jgi:hypothetical protein